MLDALGVGAGVAVADGVPLAPAHPTPWAATQLDVALSADLTRPPRVNATPMMSAPMAAMSRAYSTADAPRSRATDRRSRFMGVLEAGRRGLCSPEKRSDGPADHSAGEP